MTDQFTQPPAATQGMSGLVGALVMIQVLRHDQNMPSSFGAGREGITANVIVVDFPAEPQRVGEVLAEIPILNVGLVMSLKQAVGQTVLGRLYAKQTRAGQNPAVILGEYTPADAQLANAFIARQPLNPPQAQQPPAQQPQAQQPPAPGTTTTLFPPLPPGGFGQSNPNTPPF